MGTDSGGIAIGMGRDGDREHEVGLIRMGRVGGSRKHDRINYIV